MHTSFFHSSFKSVPFRRGVLDDTQQTAVTELFGDGGSGSHSSADPVAPLMKEPLSHSAAQQPKEWRLYPSVPYYAPMQGMQLVINVAGPEEPPATDTNSADLLKSFPQLQQLLGRTVTEDGNAYYLSSLHGSHNPLLYPFVIPPQHPPTAELDYWRYLQALHDAFMKFVALRDTCCEFSSHDICTHHMLLVRIASHPKFKDLQLLLSIEKCRLCLCLSASSKVTQQHFTQRAQDVGVELEWVLGSALVVEPLGLVMGDVNPVFAVWDVFANLHLHVAPAEGGGGDVAVTSEASSLSNTSAKNNVSIGNIIGREGTDNILRNVDVTVVSSLRFAGCECYTPTFRLSDVGRLPGGGCRLLWCVVGSMRVVMPHFVTALVESLVERSAVDRFDLRFEHGVLGSSATAAASHAAPGAGAGGPGRGVVYLTGGRRGVGHWRVSSAGLSLRAFSRLSAEFWLSDVDRRDYGLVIEGDPTPLECEFMLDSLRYSRGAGIGENGTGSFNPLASNGVRLQQPCLWGHCFQMGVCVERIISDDED